ncbi:MAG: branched-chain amino acid ABC transporter permease [Anaerolineae bacterium]
MEWLLENRTRLLTLGILIVLFLLAISGMPAEEWVITALRGLALGALTFLVAAGLSIIFGLMDVLNLAHGELFMLGAYVGWTIYVRPDTVIDGATPFLLIASLLVLVPLLTRWVRSLTLPDLVDKIWPWVGLAAGIGLLVFALFQYPLSTWDLENYAQSPISNAIAFETGTFQSPPPAEFEASPVLVIGGVIVGSGLLALAAAGFSARQTTLRQPSPTQMRNIAIVSGGLFALAFVVLAINNTLTEFMLGLGSTPRFFIAMALASVTGALLGWTIEVTMIRPLYDRPIYQIMLTLGLGFIILELVRAVWGRPEFQMPRPAVFAGTGEGCPATSIGDLVQYQCATIEVLGGRVRMYNEVFIIIVGLLVLGAVALLLQRTRLGMIIRAGVQDSEMVEALGINVRQVFSQVVALGVGLAALGGVLAGPSLGLSNGMGARVLLLALIALAVGGLTSFSGAAAGAVLIGLLQQFIIKYGQIGINVPFMAEPFKPSPPLVPASSVLLMVVILLILPQGLFGRKE